VPPTALSTAPSGISTEKAARARRIRRLYLALVGAFLVLGLFNVFGSRTGTVGTTAGGYIMRLRYPEITRSSLPVQWQLLLTHPGGFAGPVSVAVPIDYFNLFDFNNLYPTPDSTVNQGGLVVMTFPQPTGDTLDVLLDARTQAGLRAGKRTTTAILDQQGRPLVQVRYRTLVLP
jgi:hypothetical protein